jgi:uncharacterized protein YukE
VDSIAVEIGGTTHPEYAHRRYSMPQVNVDPEEVKRFAAELKAFNEQLRERTSRLQASSKRLAEKWRDQEHEKFAREFDTTKKSLDQFIRNADQHVSYLQKQAKTLDEYLSR